MHAAADALWHVLALRASAANERTAHTSALQQVAEALDGIEFGAIRRQRQESDIGRDARIAGGQMEAGLVGDDHVQGRGIGRRDLLEKARVNVPVDGRR